MVQACGVVSQYHEQQKAGEEADTEVIKRFGVEREAAVVQRCSVGLQFGEEREAGEEGDTEVIKGCGVEPGAAVEQGAPIQTEEEEVQGCGAERDSGEEAVSEKRLDAEQRWGGGRHLRRKRSPRRNEGPSDNVIEQNEIGDEAKGCEAMAIRVTAIGTTGRKEMESRVTVIGTIGKFWLWRFCN